MASALRRVVTDELPTGIEWSETSADCAIVDGTLTCTYDEILAGNDESVTITGRARLYL